MKLGFKVIIDFAAIENVVQVCDAIEDASGYHSWSQKNIPKN